MPDGKSVSPKKYRCSEPKTQELLERVFTVPADDHESRRYDEKLSLPHRSTQAEEYTGSLKALLDHYLKKLHEANDAMRHRADAGTPASESDGADAKPEPANAADKKKSANANLVPESPVETLCTGLLDVLAEYHRGLPASAFNKFDRLMTEISRTHEMPRASLKDSTQANCLFRMRLIDEGLVYPRKEIFHPSTSSRHLIGTNRYSIPGYPTLYLTDSLTLAQRESGSTSSAIVALFQLNRGFQLGIIELGIRPRDFDLNVESPRSKTSTSVERLSGRAVQNYLIWFPLLAGCSFVRAHPGSPYADEYVLPQLLMQWIRMQSSGPGGATLPPNGGGGPRGNGPGPTGPTTERERAEIPLHQEEGITELMMAFTPTMDKLSGLYDQLAPELTEVRRNVPGSLHTFMHTSRQLADMVIDAVRFVQTTHPDPEEIKQELDESGASERRVPLETLRERVNEQLKRYTSLRNAMARGGKNRISGFASTSFKDEYGALSIGFDRKFASNWMAGAVFEAIEGDQTVHSNGYKAEGESSTQALKGYLSWFGEKGSYADVVFGVSYFDQDISTKMLDGRGVSGSFSGWGWGTSVEAGHQFLMDSDPTWFIEPQV